MLTRLTPSAKTAGPCLPLRASCACVSSFARLDGAIGFLQMRQKGGGAGRR